MSGRPKLPGQVWEFRLLPSFPSFPRENRSSKNVGKRLEVPDILLPDIHSLLTSVLNIQVDHSRGEDEYKGQKKHISFSCLLMFYSRHFGFSIWLFFFRRVHAKKMKNNKKTARFRGRSDHGTPSFLCFGEGNKFLGKTEQPKKRKDMVFAGNPVCAHPIEIQRYRETVSARETARDRQTVRELESHCNRKAKRASRPAIQTAC